MKKWLVAAVSAIIIIPALTFSWKHTQAVWSAPDKVDVIEKKVDKATEIQEQIEKLILEQKSRQDKQEAVSTIQIDALQKQLELISQLKKGR